MLSLDTQSQLVKLIMTIAREEKGLEVIRQVLGEQVLFTPYTAFLRLDRKSQGFLDKTDLKAFLEANGFKTTLKKCGYVVKFYDKDFDERLSFKEFLGIVLPLDNPRLRQEVVERENYSLGKGEPLPYNVEYALARIINKEIELAEAVEKEKRDLLNRYDYKVQAAFKVIDSRHTRYITFEILSAYLEKRQTGAQPEDVAAFMRRVDQDLDCRISYNEFVAAFSPIDPKVKVKPAYITPTKAFQASAEQYKTAYPVGRSKSSVKKIGNKSFSAQKPVATPIKSKKAPEAVEKAKKFATEKKKPKSRPMSSIKKSRSPLKASPLLRASLERSPPPKEYSVYTLMEEQLEMERIIELVKQDLVLHNEVTIPRICAMFDPEGKGYIGAVDLLDTLRRLGLNPEREAAYLFFSRFDSDMDGRWRYRDVEELIMPVEEEYAEILESRFSKDIRTELKGEVLAVFKRLLLTYLEAEVENERRKERLERLDARKAFEECDIDDVGFFTLENLRIVLRDNCVNALPKDVALLMNRYDRNKDGKVTFSDFVREVKKA